ncbi:TAXI family TRAP transporter solute-binding subunit [Jiangella aurantiaca]|uniref:TAXI family TRAP transporter solute-binding subunit n=1 Tax=Jiangella aurantiaca TaxID=2530373 RepID=A0A4R5A362_9ACTN|nr:TAXI family TRAP transporter solute-binding subunit [Jiangella aurantiaca]TDD66273.1 TAXI family TRAP transporter solute-binding subunit [Jiangella aurantiaca]
MRTRVVTRLMVGVLATGLAVSACGGRQTTEPSDEGGGDAGACEAGSGRMTIATGNSTGVYYVLGGGLAQLIGDETDITATAAETGASVQNIQQLVAGDYDLAFSLADTAADATEGTGSFDEPQPVQALGRIYPNYTQVVVRTDSGITSVEDMAGKTISTGSPNSGTEVIANRLLEAAGLDPASDVQAQRLDLTKTVDGMKDGSIDGLVWSGGLPTAAMTDLFTSLGDDIAFIDVTPLLPALQEINPVYTEGEIPAETYGTDAAVPTIVVPNVLLVRDDLDEGTACALTKLVYSNVEALTEVHAAAADIDISLATEIDPIPLHPGAQQAIDELQ